MWKEYVVLKSTPKKCIMQEIDNFTLNILHKLHDVTWLNIKLGWQQINCRSDIWSMCSFGILACLRPYCFMYLSFSFWFRKPPDARCYEGNTVFHCLPKLAEHCKEDGRRPIPTFNLIGICSVARYWKTCMPTCMLGVKRRVVVSVSYWIESKGDKQ